MDAHNFKISLNLILDHVHISGIGTNVILKHTQRSKCDANKVKTSLAKRDGDILGKIS